MADTRFEDLVTWALQEIKNAQSLPEDERERHTTRTIYRLLTNVTWLDNWQAVKISDVKSEIIEIKSLWRKSQGEEMRKYFLEPIHPLATEEKESTINDATI